MFTRRRIIALVPMVAVATLATRTAHGQAAAGQKLSENDPQAKALGYVTDATHADKAKFPRYAPGQHCAACQLFQGQPSAASAPCTIFGGKVVEGKGWCSAYAPRAS